MTNFFISNLKWLEQNQSNLYSLLCERASQVEIKYDQESELWINDDLLFEDINLELIAVFKDQLTLKQRRVRTPRIESASGVPSLSVLAENFVDQHHGPFLNHLPIFSDYSTEYKVAVSRDLAVLGSLFLLPLFQIVESQDNTHNPIESITLIECDINNLIAALHLIDFSQFVDLLRSKGIVFHFIYQDNKDSLIDYTYSYYTQQIPTALHSLIVLLQPKSQPLLSSLYSWFFSQSGIGYRFLGTIGTSSDELNQVFQGLWSSASLNNNSKLIGESKYIKASTMPALLVAGGPSLDDFIPELFACQDNYFIIAAGSSIGSLLRANIRPNACAFLERGSTVYFSAKTLLDDGYNFDGIALITSETTDPRLRSLFPLTITYHRPTSALAALFATESDHCLIHAGPEAANAALDSLIALGFNEIHAFGCDFSAKSRNIPRATNAIGLSPRVLDEPVISNKGTTIYTQPNLSMTRDLFDASLLFAEQYLNKSINVFRYGEGLPLSWVESSDHLPLGNPDISVENNVLYGSLVSKQILSPEDVNELTINLKASLGKYFDSLISVLNEISVSGSYNHMKLASFLNLYSSQYDTSMYDLPVRRIMRQVVFHMVAPLFDSISSGDRYSIDTCMSKILESCSLLNIFIDQSFETLSFMLLQGKQSYEWDPNLFKDFLKVSFNTSDDS